MTCKNTEPFRLANWLVDCLYPELAQTPRRFMDAGQGTCRLCGGQLPGKWSWWEDDPTAPLERNQSGYLVPALRLRVTGEDQPPPEAQKPFPMVQCDTLASDHIYDLTRKIIWARKREAADRQKRQNQDRAVAMGQRVAVSSSF